MTFATIEMPPGVYRNGTQYQVKGRWYDANQVRWFDGLVRPIGGWTQVSTTALTGKARAMISWVENGGSRWIAIGTHSKLYVNGSTQTMYDITPVGFTPGNQDATEALGYGGGLYGDDLYGTAREGSGSPGSYLPPSSWTLDNWGENLVACLDSDGKLYEWALNTGTPAAAITNAPTGCSGLVVSEERHLIALGAGGNTRRVEWSDKENNTVWTPSAENEAGGFELQTETAIMRGLRVRGQVLIITQSDAHVLRYVGQPFVYGRERVGVGCGVISRQSPISVESRAFWMGQTSFWQFDGASVSPLDCDVADYIFSDFYEIQAAKICAGHNPQYGEVWWFYPSQGSLENDRYVIYNYREDHWAIGQLDRLAWTAGEVFGFPHAVDNNNLLFRHEDTNLANGVSRQSSIFAESSAIEVGAGEDITHVTQIIPDERTQGETTLTFKTRFTPTGTEYTYGPYAIRGDGYTDTRFSGRQMTMRVQPTVDDDWRIGKLRLKIATRGKR